MIHKEGRRDLLILLTILTAINFAIQSYFPIASGLVLAVSVILFLLVLQFFRNPSRQIKIADDNKVYAPCDGKVVVIEEANEDEYFNKKRLQLSIFMSPLNVHVNRNPISGTVNYFKYHPGKYLVAWHPKSSTENERTTVVIRNGDNEILLRQIAGALAKRIKTYLNVGDKVEQGSEMGFIKFGSRVDIFLPLDAKINVKIGDKVKGNKSIIAEF